jgi:sensor histidine kinase regulating citrate/malate metabolism
MKYRSKDRPLILQITTHELNSQGTELIFRDNGMGMNLEYFRNKIFKFGTSYHNLEESNGTGLFIVKSQLTRLNDSIDVKSEEGEFTEFLINLNKDGKKELGYS